MIELSPIAAACAFLRGRGDLEEADALRRATVEALMPPTDEHELGTLLQLSDRIIQEAACTGQ